MLQFMHSQRAGHDSVTEWHIQIVFDMVSPYISSLKQEDIDPLIFWINHFIWENLEIVNEGSDVKKTFKEEMDIDK